MVIPTEMPIAHINWISNYIMWAKRTSYAPELLVRASKRVGKKVNTVGSRTVPVNHELLCQHSCECLEPKRNNLLINHLSEYQALD